MKKKTFKVIVAMISICATFMLTACNSGDEIKIDSRTDDNVTIRESITYDINNPYEDEVEETNEAVSSQKNEVKSEDSVNTNVKDSESMFQFGVTSDEIEISEELDGELNENNDVDNESPENQE